MRTRSYRGSSRASFLVAAAPVCRLSVSEASHATSPESTLTRMCPRSRSVSNPSQKDSTHFTKPPMTSQGRIVLDRTIVVSATETRSTTRQGWSSRHSYIWHPAGPQNESLSDVARTQIVFNATEVPGGRALDRLTPLPRGACERTWFLRDGAWHHRHQSQERVVPFEACHWLVPTTSSTAHNRPGGKY